MNGRLSDAGNDLRKALEESAAQKAASAEVEKVSEGMVSEIKDAINTLAEELKPVFAENGKLLEVITPARDTNLIEVLYYPESTLKQTRGVNTAALRIEFAPKDGRAIVLRRDSFFTPFEKVETVNITNKNSVAHLAEATYNFAKSVAVK